MHKHPESFMDFQEQGDKVPSYRPTFEFPREFINKFHKSFSICPVEDELLIQLKNRRWFGEYIKGWLRRGDALKLYEIAYFVSGDILELGTYQGLSTCIMARANLDSPHKKKIETVDLNLPFLKIAEQNLTKKGLAKCVQTFCDDATALVKGLVSERRKFEFVFIDHSHAYGPVYDVCLDLRKVVPEGGFCLFHDFTDPRNRDPENEDYGVYQAVVDGLNPDEFEFYGIYGCSALYRAI